MSQTLKNVYLQHIASYLPNAPVSNDKMEQVLGMVGEVPSRVKNRILRSNGIHTRYYAIDPKTRQATHNCAELSAMAIRQLFKQGADPDCVDTLACGTSYPDQIMPGHAVMVHGLLSASLSECEVLTTAGICVSGVMALKYAFNNIRTGEARSAIACASETASSILRSENFQAKTKDWDSFEPELSFEKDFLRWMLSDGAGAMYLTAQSDHALAKIHWIDMVSYANELPVCMYAGAEIKDGVWSGWKDMDAHYREQEGIMCVKQDIKLLNTNIVPFALQKSLQRCLKRHTLTPEEIDFFLPHYSSAFFREKVYNGLKEIGFPIEYDKWFTNLPEKGNTGSASIYIMLDEFLKTKHPPKHSKILCYIPESGRFSSAFMLLETL